MSIKHDTVGVFDSLEPLFAAIRQLEEATVGSIDMQPQSNCFRYFGKAIDPINCAEACRPSVRCDAKRNVTRRFVFLNGLYKILFTHAQVIIDLDVSNRIGWKSGNLECLMQRE